MSEKDRAKLNEGNHCARCTITILQWCIQAGVRCILENPWSSKIWWLPPIQKLLRNRKGYLVRGDFCQFGTKWRKSTGFLCIHVPDHLRQRLHKICVGTNACCSRTHEKHIQRTGSAPGGMPWTRIAQPYPPALNKTLADVLSLPP